MKIKHFFPVLIIVAFSGCRDKFYTETDFASVNKIDAHVHIRSGDGTFEGIASDDNFILISPNVDHGDSADMRVQQEFASASAEKYSGRVFFEPSFFFDTAGWGTESWSIKDNSPARRGSFRTWSCRGEDMEEYRHDCAGQIREIHNG